MSPSTSTRPSFRLDDRIAIVTGASRGIGEAIALAFREAGATVVISSRDQEALEQTAARADQDRPGFRDLVPIACHAGETEAVERLFESVAERFGRLDVLVNNAATNPHFGPATSCPLPAFDKTVEVNLRGYFLASQLAARTMTEQGSGAIVNVASILGLSPAEHQVVYSMTKAGVISMTRGMARELGPSGIRVNAIAPGLVETRFSKVLIETEDLHRDFVDRTPLRRHATPDEIAGAAVYLASDAASFTTGSVLVVDGGFTA